MQLKGNTIKTMAHLKKGLLIMRKESFLLALALLFFLTLIPLRFASAAAYYCDTQCDCTDAQCGSCYGCSGVYRQSCAHKQVTDCICMNCGCKAVDCDTSCGAACEAAGDCNGCDGAVLYSSRTCASSCSCTGGSSENCATKASVCTSVSNYRDYVSCSGSACTYNDYESDSGQTYCDTCKGAGYWNLGGEVSATTCCEDTGENKDIFTEYAGTTHGVIDWGTSQDACCDSSSDMVNYSGACVASGTGGNAVDTGYTGHDKYAYPYTSGWLDLDGHSTWPAAYGANVCSGGWMDMSSSDSTGERCGTAGGDACDEDANYGCCGDDSGENGQTRLCTSGCTTTFSDKSCCDVSTDCVYGSTCYSTGWTGTAPWNASANGSCIGGSWSQNPPTAPSGLTATSSATSTTQINLAWTDNSLNETGFRVRRANGVSCNVSSSLIATTNANIIAYSNSGLAEGTKYCYVVCSYNADGETCSSSSTATTSLSAPSAASFGTIAPTSMVVNWTDNSSNEAGFQIERATGSCSTGFSQIGTASADAITYTDTTLSCSGTSYDTYCYRVRAYTADADSSYTTIASTKPTLPCTASSLNASVVSASQVDLSWIDNSGNETGFKINRKTGSGGTYSLLATKSADVTSHSDSGLSDGTTYYYRAYSYNDDGSSNYSNEVFATTTLPAPSNFLAAASSSSQINLTWTDNSSNETGFKIERATTTCAGFLSMHTTLANVTSYFDEELVQNTTYCYRAYAFNDNTSSSYSNESSTTTEVFIPSGYLESSTFDIGSGATFNTILWGGQLNGGYIRFTFASSNCPNGSTDYPTCAGGSLWGNSAGGGAPFLGNDGTETGYYGPPIESGKATPLRAVDHNQRRYFRYRIYLTAGPSDTPNVSSVIIGYSP